MLLVTIPRTGISRLQVKVNLKSSGRMCSSSLTVSNLLTIGEVARRSGVASSALRFYEQRGLISSERAGRATAATRGQCCAGSPSSSSPNASG